MPAWAGATIRPRWPLPIGRDDVDDPADQVRRARSRAAAGRCGWTGVSAGELDPVLGRLGVGAVDAVDAHHRVELLLALALAGLAHLARRWRRRGAGRTCGPSRATGRRRRRRPGSRWSGRTRSCRARRGCRRPAPGRRPRGSWCRARCAPPARVRSRSRPRRRRLRRPPSPSSSSCWSPCVGCPAGPAGSAGSGCAAGCLLALLAAAGCWPLLALVPLLALLPALLAILLAPVLLALVPLLVLLLVLLRGPGRRRSGRRSPFCRSCRGAPAVLALLALPGCCRRVLRAPGAAARSWRSCSGVVLALRSARPARCPAAARPARRAGRPGLATGWPWTGRAGLAGLVRLDGLDQLGLLHRARALDAEAAGQRLEVGQQHAC